MLPDGRTRVVLQFDRPVNLRPTNNAAANVFVLRSEGAMLAPGVPNYYPVNAGNVQNVSLAFVNGGVQIAILMFSAAHPTVTAASNAVYFVDVPGNGPSQASQPYSNQYAQVPLAGALLTRMYRLRYADVSEVVGLLAQNVTVAPSNAFNPQTNQLNNSQQFGYGQYGQYGGYGQFGQYGYGANGIPQSTFGQFQYPQYQYPGTGTESQLSQGQRINDNLAIDRRLNAVIVTGTPQQIAQAEAIIKLVDIPVKSVMIDAEVLEITESGEKALGFDYGQTPTTPISRVFNSQSQIINGIPAGAIPGALEFQTNIFLLVSKGQARILASPKILTEDGLPASILTGDSLPIRVTVPVGVGGVGAVTSQVEYINVGVNLQILPHITGEHAIETSVFSQVSSVTGFTSSNDPQISSRQAQTRVNLVEGQTLVIGGLLQQRDIRNLQKIPIIGDLPLIGALFRFYTETRQNTNLIITITPHIVPAPEDVVPPMPGQPRNQ